MILKLLKLGWKNIWRNPTRSGVVITAVLLGCWAGIFLSAFFNGMIQDYLKNELELSVGHIQIMHPSFSDLQNPDFSIQQADILIDKLIQKKYARELRYESQVTGLAQSAINSFGVSIHGIPAADSNTISHPLKKYIVEGNLLESDMKNPITIGKSLAERLDLDLRSKLVLNFQDVEGEITAGAFRVAGIYDTFNDQFEQRNVYLKREDLNALLNRDDAIHKITLQISDFTQADNIAASLRADYPDLDIKSWAESSPALNYVFESMDISLYVIMVIIIIALVFSIINTMLMAVLERTRELGMLMALGMNHTRIFFMIVTETIFLTMIGTPIGFLFSWLTITYFENNGIHLSAFAEGLNSYGLGSTIYPALSPEYYLNITLLILTAAILSALYPAWKTMQLNPVEAIRKI